MDFLKAEWRNLVLVNYAVDDELLRPYLPAACELDRWQGKAQLSLVAFQFLRTKVLGVGWPGFRDFPEINLRFYVRQGGLRGVCFIREYVPSAWVAFLARALYNEPYATARLGWDVRPEQVSYWMQKGAGGPQLKLTVARQAAAYLPDPDSLAHFFKEHENGFGRDRAQRTTLYKVEHPHWRVYPTDKLTLEVDWAGLYGEQFAFLSKRTPDSVVLAEGSAIRVGFLR